MALPVGLTTIAVTGTYEDASGAAQAGSVSFTPTSTVVDATGKVVLTQTAVMAVLDSSGSFTLTLPCTDNAGLTPLGWGYVLTVSVPGASGSLDPIYLPHALGSTVDISALTESFAAPAPSGVSYYPNASAVPAAGPAGGGGFLYAGNGSLYWINPSNTVTQIAPNASQGGGAVTPTGPASGDLSGTYPGPTVTATHLAAALPLGQGGTGQASAAAAYNALSPMTTLGDIEYESGAATAARLAGNITATKNYLTQTGTGAVSAAPAWGTIAAADLPTGTTSAQGALQLDGTAADIAALGTRVAGAIGKAADAGHVHPTSGLQVPVSAWPSGCIAQTLQPVFINTSSTAVTGGQMYIHSVMLAAGVQVSNISYLIGTTAGTTLTHGWFALLNPAFLQVAHTADQTSGGLTASTLVTKPLTSAYTPPSAGQYWLAIVVVASQQPTLGGFGTPQGTSGFAVAPVSGTSTGSLTGPGTDNTTTYLAPQAATNPAYAYVS